MMFIMNGTPFSSSLSLTFSIFRHGGDSLGIRQELGTRF